MSSIYSAIVDTTSFVAALNGSADPKSNRRRALFVQAIKDKKIAMTANIQYELEAAYPDIYKQTIDIDCPCIDQNPKIKDVSVAISQTLRKSGMDMNISTAHKIALVATEKFYTCCVVSEDIPGLIISYEKICEDSKVKHFSIDSFLEEAYPDQ